MSTPNATEALACRQDPDRWFDRTNRTHALERCLACPARSWCAREALIVRPKHGMWAGIWIEGNLAAVENYLRAIAAPESPTTPPPETVSESTPAPAPAPDIRPPAAHTVAAAIIARSSGHCEIMAQDCRFGFEMICSRVLSRGCDELPDPACGYAACRNCRVAVRQMEFRLARQLGYIVNGFVGATAVPFYWRQRHWLRLDSAGGAAPFRVAEQTA